MVTNFKEFIETIESYGENIFIEKDSNEHAVSYSDLATRIKKAAVYIAKSTRRGDRILLYKLSELDWAIAYFAIIISGRICVCLDKRANQDMFDSVIELTCPVQIISTEANTSKKITHHNVAQMLVSTDDYLTAYNELETNPDGVCQIIFSSGTWSSPKGIALSQKNILASITGSIFYNDWDKSKYYISILPYSHIYGQVCGLVMNLYFGKTFIHLQPPIASNLSLVLNQYHPESLIVVPKILDLLEKRITKQLPWIKKLLWFRHLPVGVRRIIFWPILKKLGGHLKTFYVGGAPLSLTTDRFFQMLGVNVYIGYGLTETTSLIFASKNQHRQAGELGRIIPGSIYRLNQNNEILVKGPTVFLGYWPNLNSTDEWFNTRDIAERDMAGNLTLKGRTSNLVIYPTGDKIFLDDIELAANTISGVDESCAIHNQDSGVPELKLVVVSNEKNISTAFEKHLRSKLPAFVNISECIYTDQELPKTLSLKLNRKKITSIYNSGSQVFSNKG
jgi:long-chain acyl-CoA synthetase